MKLVAQSLTTAALNLGYRCSLQQHSLALGGRLRRWLRIQEKQLTWRSEESLWVPNLNSLGHIFKLSKGNFLSYQCLGVCNNDQNTTMDWGGHKTRSTSSVCHSILRTPVGGKAEGSHRALGRTDSFLGIVVCSIKINQEEMEELLDFQKD